ncbi:hypothetical protein B0T14DRAFT_568067 [Immersiella caudata]|uniref:Uncharacterized protein n=1 Tax=Immersiella caudata TaxID=314043 RepID=A0AA39WJD9_9PEZI|nr:hypothetical protein B0T14DRAFT_568067 [Immersiella caudata]
MLGALKSDGLFAAFAQSILKAAQKDGRGDETEVTRLLADCHHNQSLSTIYTESGGAVEHAKVWLGILLNKIERLYLDEDVLPLAAAYNQIALCHIYKDEVEEATRGWSMSLDAYRTVPNVPKLGGIWPATSLALIYIIGDWPTEANDVLTRVLKEREEVLGKDDKTTSESEAVWRTMGKIRIRQQQYDEGLDYLRDCFYEIGLDFLRKRDTVTAVHYPSAAMRAFGDAPWRKAQTARVLWEKEKVARSDGNAAEGDAFIKRAMEIRKEVVPNDKRLEEQLTYADWDNVVFYYSR